MNSLPVWNKLTSTSDQNKKIFAAVCCFMMREVFFDSSRRPPDSIHRSQSELREEAKNLSVSQPARDEEITHTPVPAPTHSLHFLSHCNIRVFQGCVCVCVCVSIKLAVISGVADCSLTVRVHNNSRQSVNILFLGTEAVCLLVDRASCPISRQKNGLMDPCYTYRPESEPKLT